MKISELIPFLEQIDARPSKRLSQNFLIDSNIVRKIVELADVKEGDIVLEIGPGPGALTSELLSRNARVFAVEIDAKLASELHRLQTPDQRLSIFTGDFLKFPLEQIPLPFKVVANLPYHITSPILEKVCTGKALSTTVMVQKEMAERMMAAPKSKDFSSFTLFLQFYTKIYGSFTVSASCFYPRPRVDSMVIRLDASPTPPVDPAPFFAFVRKAFMQRRKMIRTSLSENSNIVKALGNLQNARPEELCLKDWIDLYEKASETS